MRLPAWLTRLIAPLQQNRWERELSADIQEHLDLAIEENLRRGMSPDEAAAVARRSFGGAEQMKESYRDQRGIPALETFARELRLAFRSLLRAPAFAVLAIGTLALAIGANSAIFSAVNTLLFRPPGIVAPDRLAVIRSQYTKLNLKNLIISSSDYEDVKAAGVFSSIALARTGGEFTFTSDAVPQRLSSMSVTSQWFDVLGVQPAMGRLFNSGDEQLPAKPIVLLTHAAWQRVFGGDPAIVGKSIRLDQRPFTVVGILKPEYTADLDDLGGGVGQPKDVIVPMVLRANPDDQYTEHFLAVGRLAPGVSITQAGSALRALTERGFAVPGIGAFRKGNGWALFVMPYTDFAGGDMKTPLLILWGSVGLVLLIAAANIAGLTLARLSARTRELAVRTALGGTRWHLLRQLFAESALVSIAGSIAGLAVAYGFSRAIELYAPPNVVAGLHIPFDAPMLAFTAFVGLVAAGLSTLAPAAQLMRKQAGSLLKDTGRATTASRSRLRLRSFLVSSEVALALVLSIGAGLLLRSLSSLESIETGLRPQGVMTASFALAEARYQDPDRIVAFHRQVIDRLKSVPGATSAAISYPLPFGPGLEGRAFYVAGRPVVPSRPAPQANIRLITPEFFTALGIPLVRGRAFTDQDAGSSTQVTIIDQTLADRYWPKEDPIGQKIIQGPRTLLIVGVVGHTTQTDVASTSDRGYFYVPLYQDIVGFGTLIVKAPGDAASLSAAMQGAVTSIDPAQPIYDTKTMQQRVDATFAGRRFTVVLLACFALTSVFLAALGLYGVINYGVTQRTQEIGIRVALGAQRTQVLGLILGQGLKIALAGLAAGAAAAYWIAVSLPDQLFGVNAFDPLTFASTALLVAGIAVLATFVPARRAMLLDPVEACRRE